jgi:glycosyltransferase involved in cell wall biosynthesis
MKILFTSYAVPPVYAPGSMRIFNFAKYLSEQKDYTVEILHCSNPYDSMQDHNRKWDFGKIKLIPVADIFDKNNLISSDEPLNDPKSSVSKKIKIKVLKNMSDLVFPDRNISWAVNVFRKKVLKNKYDYIISSYPSITNLIVGHYYSKLFKTPLIVDMRDLWTQDPNFSQKKSLRKRLESKIESDILSKSHKILTVSEFNALQLSKIYGNKVEVIYNGFENSKFKEFRLVNDIVHKESQIEDSKFKMAYAGSFYNGERNVDKLFKAIKSLKDKEIINENNFCFDIYGRKEDYITQIIGKHQLSELVSVKGLVNQDALFKKLDGYNLLLVVTRNAEISKGEMTTKVFEYIALGNPILCLAKADFEIVKVLNDIDYTYCVDLDDEVVIENTLESVIASDLEHHTKRKLSFDFSRDTMSDKLKNILEK